MKYVKISDNEIKGVDEKVYNLSELRDEIASMKEEYDNWDFLEYPEDCSGLMKEAIDQKNKEIDAEREHFRDFIVNKEKLLEKLEKYV